MKKTMVIFSLFLLISFFSGNALGWYEGEENTFYGCYAGAATNGDDDTDTFIGSYAGNSNTSGFENTFVGFESGKANTTGSNNTFIGFQSGLSNKTGISNVFIGPSTGQLNISGNFNTFIGDYSGYNNTVSNNTFIGYGTGYYNTIGTYNTYLGTLAGQGQSGLSTGSNNTFMGYYTGYSNTTGQYNTFFGSQAGLGNSTGYGNNFTGYRAGYRTSTGYHNNFMGYLAGNGNTIGAGNTAVGGYAGYTNETSNGNTFIGYSAGFSTTGGGNVFIGYKAGRNETGSNKLYVDNSETATPLIYGDFAANTVEINGILYAVMGSPSSRELKDNIQCLKAKDAMETLQGLNPVTFNYKTSPEENHVGFIAEDVPALVAMKDRKAIGPMDVVAVLTKVVQEQQEIIAAHTKEIADLKTKVSSFELTNRGNGKGEGQPSGNGQPATPGAADDQKKAEVTAKIQELAPLLREEGFVTKEDQAVQARVAEAKSIFSRRCRQVPGQNPEP